MVPILYSPNEPEHFLGFFASWIQIQEAYLYADPDPDPKHRFKMKTTPDDYTEECHCKMKTTTDDRLNNATAK